MCDAMLPIPFSREEIEQIQSEELWDSGTLRSLKQCLKRYDRTFIKL